MATLDCVVVDMKEKVVWCADNIYREKYGGKFGVTLRPIQSCRVRGHWYQIEDDQSWKVLGKRGDRSGAEVVAVCMETCQLVTLRFEKL